MQAKEEFPHVGSGEADRPGTGKACADLLWGMQAERAAQEAVRRAENEAAAAHWRADKLAAKVIFLALTEREAAARFALDKVRAWHRAACRRATDTQGTCA